MNVYYYNLRHSNRKVIKDGCFLDFDLMINLFWKKNKEIFEINGFSRNKIKDVLPHFEKNREEWMKMFSTVVYILTGCILNDFDKSNIKNIYSKLKELSKKNSDINNLLNDRRFIFMCLPFLSIGFNVGTLGWSINGSNNFNNFFSVIEQLMKPNASMSTFFCAHREKAPVLVKNLDFNSIVISCNLCLGILKNFNLNIKKKKLLTIYQPDCSVYGISSVFPEIFLEYLNNRKLGELIYSLNKHHKTLEEFLLRKYGGEVCLSSLINHKKQVVSRCKKIFGENFMNLEKAPIGLLFEDESGKNLEFIIEDAEEKILRFINFYGNVKIEDSLIKENILNSKTFENEIRNIENLMTDSIKDFLNIKFAYGKAIYEAVFYIIWGERAFKKNEIVIGLERDHNLYQTRAISFGFHLGNATTSNQHNVPVLFAKRKTRNQFLKMSDLSFRQFFRLSEEIIIEK